MTSARENAVKGASQKMRSGQLPTPTMRQWGDTWKTLPADI